MQALWTLQTKGALDNPTLVALFNDRVVPAEVVRAALKIFSEQPALANQHLPEIYASMGSVGRANDPFAPLTLAALLALGAAEPSAEANEQLVAAIPNLKDPFLQSAALAAATRSPGEFLRATLAAGPSGVAALQPFIAPVCAALSSQSARRRGPHPLPGFGLRIRCQPDLGHARLPRRNSPARRRYQPA